MDKNSLNFFLFCNFQVVYEATTAVGLTFVKGLSNSLVMVTTDGSDSCMPNESYCGLFSPDLASLMKEVFGCSVAMSMDQGNLSTLITFVFFVDVKQYLYMSLVYLFVCMFIIRWVHWHVDQGRKPLPQRHDQPQRQQDPCGTGRSQKTRQRPVP